MQPHNDTEIDGLEMCIGCQRADQACTRRLPKPARILLAVLLLLTARHDSMAFYKSSGDSFLARHWADYCNCIKKETCIPFFRTDW